MSSDTTLPALPPRIRGLLDLVYNLHWSWDPQTRGLFRMLDLQTWRECGHNPVLMLSLLPQGVLLRASNDHDFVERYDEVMDRFGAESTSQAGWFTARYGHPAHPLAYFSAEYGLHVSLPLYAGGLGILAGDHLKECSDLAIPVVGVGLIYSRGYVSQYIREDGWPEDAEETLDRRADPIMRVLDGEGRPVSVQVPVFDPPVHVAVWKAQVGRVPLYLLDTDVEENQAWDRAIVQHLYTSDPEQRLRQEIVLGIGGMRVLEALNMRPAALHLNEGHPAFAILERMHLLVKDGTSPEDAHRQIRESTIFTTHTPLAAGTDVFPFPLMEKYFRDYCSEAGIDRDQFYQLGADPQDPGAGFNMTVFALRMARFCNAVSQRHGEVARQMWSGVCAQVESGDVPIRAITNGVHLPTWIEPIHLQPFLDRYLGVDWATTQDSPETWQRVDGIPDEALWDVHQRLKGLLIAQIDARLRERWQRDRVAAGNVVALGALLAPEVLTIGFARRFTGYKRPDLILWDVERLRRLLTDPWHPVQIIFSGKAHPADIEGKRLIQKIFRLCQDPESGGRIAFVENYDQQLAAYMVHGVDVWLNTPLPPLEASGTSGMKASVNGVPNLSVLDGWWIEGHQTTNGWAFGVDVGRGDRTEADAEALYSLLEEQIIPLYYQRSDDGIPHAFVEVMKAAIKTVAPAFSARRMVKEYAQTAYAEALGLVE